MKLRIQGGTARLDEPALCLSCRFARIAQGPRSQDRIVYCSQIETAVTFQVTDCTEYIHRRHPSLWHMEDIAWILRTDLKRKQIGFVRAKDLKFVERHVLEDD